MKEINETLIELKNRGGRVGSGFLESVSETKKD